MKKPLTHQQIVALKPKGKPYKVFDQRGLYVQVAAKGSKTLNQRYRKNGKETRIRFGRFPDVTLQAGREKRDKVLQLLARGIDPAVHQAAALAALAPRKTFAVVARDWQKMKAAGWASNYAEKVDGRLEKYVLPLLGSKAIADIRAPEVLNSVRRIEAQGLNETARRTLTIISAIFSYAVITELVEVNPTRELRGVLQRAKPQGFATIIDPEKIGPLLLAIDAYNGSAVTRHALQLLPLLFVRPGELRHAEWSEFKLDGPKPTWRIPPKKMKMRAEHVVPLSLQSVALLRSLHAITGPEGLLFPGVRSKEKPISENTLNAALRYMGYPKEEITSHGFRAMASTLLNDELECSRDAIEHQLAHKERNKSRAAYNYAEFLPTRRNMMQSWADYLDSLKQSSRRKKLQPIA